MGTVNTELTEGNANGAWERGSNLIMRKIQLWLLLFFIYQISKNTQRLIMHPVGDALGRQTLSDGACGTVNASSPVESCLVTLHCSPWPNNSICRNLPYKNSHTPTKSSTHETIHQGTFVIPEDWQQLGSPPKGDELNKLCSYKREWGSS